MTKQNEETTSSSETLPSPSLAAMTAKAARISNVPTNEDIRRQQEEQMEEVQRALFSYRVPPVPEPIAASVLSPSEAPPVVENKLPARTIKMPRYGADRHA